MPADGSLRKQEKKTSCRLFFTFPLITIFLSNFLSFTDLPRDSNVIIWLRYNKHPIKLLIFRIRFWIFLRQWFVICQVIWFPQKQSPDNLVSGRGLLRGSLRSLARPIAIAWIARILVPRGCRHTIRVTGAVGYVVALVSTSNIFVFAWLYLKWSFEICMLSH